jgi:hypothetical protein
MAKVSVAKVFASGMDTAFGAQAGNAGGSAPEGRRDSIIGARFVDPDYRKRMAIDIIVSVS